MSNKPGMEVYLLSLTFGIVWRRVVSSTLRQLYPSEKSPLPTGRKRGWCYVADTTVAISHLTSLKQNGDMRLTTEFNSVHGAYSELEAKRWRLWCTECVSYNKTFTQRTEQGIRQVVKNSGMRNSKDLCNISPCVSM